MDENISSVNAVASQKTLYNPFETRNKFWDPYGVGKSRGRRSVICFNFLFFKQN